MHFDTDPGIGITHDEDVVPTPHIGLSCLATPIESDATPDGLPTKYDGLVLGFEHPQPWPRARSQLGAIEVLAEVTRPRAAPALPTSPGHYVLACTLATISFTLALNPIRPPHSHSRSSAAPGFRCEMSFEITRP